MYNIFEEEANQNGKIIVTLNEGCCGGRESIETEWEIEMSADCDTWFEVRATCTRSEDPRYEVGYYIDFDLDKEFDIYDMDSELRRALEDEWM